GPANTGSVPAHNLPPDRKLGDIFELSSTSGGIMTAMPALYLGHGAPPLVDDELWTSQLRAWAADLPRPTAILIVSAHWESAPLTVGATATGVPLVYDFGGFPAKYYQARYPSPGAPELPARITAL